ARRSAGLSARSLRQLRTPARTTKRVCFASRSSYKENRRNLATDRTRSPDIFLTFVSDTGHPSEPSGAQRSRRASLTQKSGLIPAYPDNISDNQVDGLGDTHETLIDGLGHAVTVIRVIRVVRVGHAGAG